MEPKDYMDMALTMPEVGYTIRKHGGEISVSLKALEIAGGVEAMVRRVVGVYLEMPEAYRKIGVTWFPEANQFALELSQTYNLTLWQVSQIIAVLSPQNPWDGAFDKEGRRYKDGNRLCTTKLIKAWFEGGETAVYALRGWGYAPAFVAKAILILQGQELDWSDAPKTYRFALLIANPTLIDIAVCDSHSSRVATGNLGNRYHVVTVAAYPTLEKVYLIAGDILGIPAQECQAATWQFAADGLLY